LAPIHPPSDRLLWSFRPNEQVLGEEAELERVPTQTHMSHVVASPIAPTREDDRVLIRSLGDR
jgi:hypothetical protein